MILCCSALFPKSKKDVFLKSGGGVVVDNDRNFFVKRNKSHGGVGDENIGIESKPSGQCFVFDKGIVFFERESFFCRIRFFDKVAEHPAILFQVGEDCVIVLIRKEGKKFSRRKERKKLAMIFCQSFVDETKSLFSFIVKNGGLCGRDGIE